jgi:hypothetical protein
MILAMIEQRVRPQPAESVQWVRESDWKGEEMKSPIGLSTIVRQSKDQVSCSLNDEVALLNLKTTLYFGLNEVGASIWQALKEPTPAIELCRLVRDRFEVDETQCQTHVLEFLTNLEKAGLIELIPSEPSG